MAEQKRGWGFAEVVGVLVPLFAIGYLVTHPKDLWFTVKMVLLAGVACVMGFGVLGAAYALDQRAKKEAERREKAIRRRIEREIDQRDDQWELHLRSGGKDAPPRRDR